jgi:hypothetical protein
MAPTILFVPGAWHTPAHFVPISNLLHTHGYKTSCPTLPSCGGFGKGPMQDDANAVKAELERLLIEGADIVLVGHSYGGLVVTEAALVEYSKVARAGKRLEGGVIHILYLCAVLLQPGQTPSALSIEGITDPGKVTIDVCTSALFYGYSL